MPIKITKQEERNERGDDLYIAEVTTPEGTWRSPPLPSFELESTLFRMGCNILEIRHAFQEAGVVHTSDAKYRYVAKITRPFLLAALAGEREVPEQEPFTEAWLADALLFYDRMLPLWDVIESADAINHGIANYDEISWAFLRLRRRGWLAVDGETYGLTRGGRRAAQDIVSRGKDSGRLLDRVRKLEKWFSDHPPPGDE